MAQLQTIRIDLIDRSPHNPRRTFDTDALNTLASSIERVGVLSPILVVNNPTTGRYEIVAGERRWRASELARQVEIPAFIIEGDDPIVREIQIVENLEREQLNPIDEGLAFQSLMTQFNYTEGQLAQRFRRSPQFIRSRLDLVRLDQRVQQLVIDGRIAIGSALELLRLEDPDMQLQAAQRVEHERLTAEATASLVLHQRFEQRLLANQTTRRMNFERREQELAAEGIVITPHSLDPTQHHRVWDLRFLECQTCQLKGTFLRTDGQIEAVCVVPTCYDRLVQQQRTVNERAIRTKQADRRAALEQVLDVEDVMTAHLHYLLWTMLDLMGPAADAWRREIGLPISPSREQAHVSDWEAISSWSDEQLLSNIMRLSMSHIAALSNDVLPPGLKRSLTQNFGVASRLLDENPL